MDRIQLFEDLIAWQKARALTREIYLVTDRPLFQRDWDLKRQMRRCIVSTMSNIAEGFDRAGRREFHQFLSIAKGSCAELRSQLYVAFDAGYLTPEEFERLRELATEVIRIVAGLRSAVARQHPKP